MYVAMPSLVLSPRTQKEVGAGPLLFYIFNFYEKTIIRVKTSGSVHSVRWPKSFIRATFPTLTIIQQLNKSFIPLFQNLANLMELLQYLAAMFQLKNIPY